MNIIGRRNIYFLISGLVLVPGMIALFMWGLHYGIDFTGGSHLEVESKNNLDRSKVEIALKDAKIDGYTIQMRGEKALGIRMKPIQQKEKEEIVKQLKRQDKDIKETTFETVGPVIGDETKRNAITAVIVASAAIALYIAWAFREVSRPVSSWKFGIAAIVALIHDTLVVIGAFAILGHFLSVEVDSLFITALLTVMGFSVHDTIVVFDRIRENLKRTQDINFEKILNNSVLETMNRSLNTSLTVVFVLVALLLFGGGSIRWFVVAFLVGIISGTYSSIFTASPLLLVWYNWDRRRIKK